MLIAEKIFFRKALPNFHAKNPYAITANKDKAYALAIKDLKEEGFIKKALQI